MRGNGLRLTNMTVPLVADTNNSVELQCHFDMESEELYAVKWYKDDQEFFRYRPHQQPHKIDFPVSGVHVVLQKSDCGNSHCRVHLTKLTRHQSDGSYRCEVSSEAPTFRLAAETHNMTVATLPKAQPRIEGLEEGYNEGDILAATCISSPSDPQAILTWHINNQEAPAKFVDDNVKPSDEDRGEGPRFRSASLRFQINRKHVVQTDHDVVELRCVARLPGVPMEPQMVQRIVALKIHRPQVVSNQKLHWLSSDAGEMRRPLGVLFVCVAMVAVRW